MERNSTTRGMIGMRLVELAESALCTNLEGIVNLPMEDRGYRNAAKNEKRMHTPTPE
jgi:hypothetical protein